MTTVLDQHLNVSAWLPELAKQHPDALAVAVARSPNKYQTLSASQLDHYCDRVAHGLVDAGITKGTRTVVMVKPSSEFFAITFALFKIGAIPVMVDPGMGIRNLGTCLRDADPAAFIGTPRAHVARRLCGWAKDSLETIITVGTRFLWGGHKLDRLCQHANRGSFELTPTEADQTAAILFTSGSTGTPKGVLYTHANFAAQVESLRATYKIQPGDIDLSTFPLFSLFGPALGMTCIVPFMDTSRPGTANPQHLTDAIQRFSCTSMFASPMLIDKLGRHCQATLTQLASLRRIISAGAPANNHALATLTEHLADDCEIHTPYGATEALPVTSITSSEILTDTRHQTDTGAGVCVGSPVAGVEVAIIRVSDDPIPNWNEQWLLATGQTGEIVVKGAIVTASYFQQESATSLAKIADGDEFWHRMGDLGYLDQSGRLWMCGRKSHRVQTPTETLFTIPCEAVFTVHPQVRRAALVDAQGTPTICIELEIGFSKSAILEDELQDIARRHPHTRCISRFLFHPKFPVDVRHNAKIYREQLATWAEAKR
jgi:acyl-CoA synthetase (AMP-forming)/AMP-acid ligase II